MPTRSCSSSHRVRRQLVLRRAGGGRARALRPARAAPRDRPRLTCADSQRISALMVRRPPADDIFNAMPTSLVTGGAGFLGSHICDFLLERGHRVVCVDNLETGSLNNIKHIREPGFRFEMLDITDHYEIDEPVDFVYHMASPASPIDYARLPLHTLKVGAYGTHNTLGPGEEAPRPLPDRLHQRGVRRSARAPAAGDLLGQREPDRPARRLRRGQALRRGAHDGLPAPAGRGHVHRTDLQHLRPADAAQRRARRARPSCARPSTASPSRSSATGPRRAASVTSRT